MNIRVLRNKRPGVIVPYSAKRTRNRALRIEALEDRQMLAASITVVPGQSGDGTQDANLLADGRILFGDADLGANTLSTGALAALAATADIVVESAGSITFQDLGGTFTLPTTAGSSASFSTDVDGGTFITFADPASNILATSGGALTLSARSNLLVGGLRSGGGDLTLRAGGSIEANDTAERVDIDAWAGKLNLTAGATAADARLSIMSAEGVRGTGGITLIADAIDIGDFTRLDAAEADVLLRPFRNETMINLGGLDSSNVLGLSNPELGAITAGKLEIGDDTGGDIFVSAVIGSFNWHSLSLRTGGSIRDASPGEQSDVTVAGPLVLRAGTGIGPADDLDILSTYVAFDNKAGTVNIRGQAGVVIKAIDELLPSSNSGTNTSIGSDYDVIVAGHMTVMGDLRIEAVYHIEIAPDVTLDVQAGNLYADAGDSIDVGQRSSVRAAGTITLNRHVRDDHWADAAATIYGTVDAGQGMPAITGVGTVAIRFDLGARFPDGLRLEGMMGPQYNLLSLSDRTSPAPHSYAIDGNRVVRDETTSIEFSGLGGVGVIGGSAADTFRVVPSATAVNVEGLDPAPPSEPGDSLFVDIAGTTDATLEAASYSNGTLGVYRFANRQQILFSDMESISPTMTDLSVEVTNRVRVASPGETLTYLLNYQNVGELAAIDVVLTAPLPPGTVFDPRGSTPGWTETSPGSGVFTLIIGQLPADELRTAVFSVIIQDSTAQQTVIRQIATIVDRKSRFDRTRENNSATNVTFLSTHGLISVGADAGGGPHVRVLSNNAEEVFSFFAFAPTFTGGVRVAMGDVTGDGIQDVVAAAGAGGGPHVRVFDGATGEQIDGPLGSFFAYGAGFTGGVFVATADFDHDGHAEIVTGAGAGGEPRVRVFSGMTGAELLSFVDPPKGGNGVRVATGDLDGDGTPDIITGSGPNMAATVRVFSGATGQPLGGSLGNLTPYPGFSGGVFVAAGDVNGDGRDDVISGADAGGGPHVKVFSGVGGAEIASLFAFGAGFTGGVRVAAGDVDQDGTLDIIAGAGPGGGPHVRAFRGAGGVELASFFAYDATFTGGLFVAGAINLPGIPAIAISPPEMLDVARLAAGAWQPQSTTTVAAPTASAEEPVVVNNDSAARSRELVFAATADDNAWLPLLESEEADPLADLDLLTERPDYELLDSIISLSSSG